MFGRLSSNSSPSLSSAGLTESRKDPEPLPDSVSDPFFDLQFRLILLGDSGAGKSSLLRRFTSNAFHEHSDPTVGIDFFAKTVTLNSCNKQMYHDYPGQVGPKVKLQLWDTAGQERFRSITRSYYRHSVGVVLVYDPFERSSFMHLGQWMHEAQRHIEPRTAVYTVIAAKCDLLEVQGLQVQVALDEGRQWAEARGAHFFQTSAKTGLNVDLAIASLAERIHEKVLRHELSIQEGWDGIKKGVFTQMANSSASMHPSVRTRRSNNTVTLLEAQPADHPCC